MRANSYSVSYYIIDGLILTASQPIKSYFMPSG